MNVKGGKLGNDAQVLNVITQNFIMPEITGEK
jgi:hypothetical protein